MTNEVLYASVEPGVYRITDKGVQIEEILMLNLREKCVSKETVLFIESNRNSFDEENNAMNNFVQTIRQEMERCIEQNLPVQCK